MNCASCGEKLPAPPWYRSDECPKCAASLHACVHCHFLDPLKENQCGEPQAERIVDKERANFCDYFKGVGSNAIGNNKGQTGEKEKTLNELEKLFKK
jgi:hypothetical protein